MPLGIAPSKAGAVITWVMYMRTRSALVGIGLLASICLLSTASAWAETEDVEPFYLPVVWKMEPLLTAAPEGMRQARIDDALFLQEVRSAGDAVLTREFATPESWGSTTRLVLPSGARLSRIAGATEFTFCDPRITYRAPNPVDGRLARVCLLDREGDGVFDFVYWGGVAGEDFHPMGLTNPREVSASYMIAEASPVLTVGLVVTRSLGSYRLELAVLDNGEMVVLRDIEGLRPMRRRPLNEVRFRARDLPTTIEYSGAQVTVHAIEQSTVQYTVLSTLSPETPLGIAVSAELIPHD